MSTRGTGCMVASLAEESTSTSVYYSVYVVHYYYHQPHTVQHNTFASKMTTTPLRDNIPSSDMNAGTPRKLNMPCW